MDAAQAIHAFWSGFGVKAYDENTVPEDAKWPRLTYEYAEAGFDEPILLGASLWYHSMSWGEIHAKAKEISDYIGGGHMQPYDDGSIFITKMSPFIQRMEDPDPNIRRIVLTIYADFLGG